jgi:gliding motility-associated-like protein
LYKVLTDLQITNCSLTADTLAADCKLIIPNIITPNNDGMNDFFAIRKLNLERENELTIYDRWGKNVFRKKNYKSIFKNGEYLNIDKDTFIGLTRGGQKLPDGAYYFSFVYDALPKKITYSGTIVIIRDE